MRVHELQRRLEIRDPQHHEHGPEDLLVVDPHVGADVIEQAAAEIEPLRVIVDPHLASVDDEVRPLVNTALDIAAHPLQVFASYERPHLRAVARRRPYPQVAHHRRERRNEPVAGISDGDRGGYRHAAFTGGPESRSHQRLRRLLHVGVRHDRHVILGAAQRLHALPVRAGRRIDVLGDGRRTDKAHRTDPVIPQKDVDRLLAAVDDVEDAVRQTCFF